MSIMVELLNKQLIVSVLRYKSVVLIAISNETPRLRYFLSSHVCENHLGNQKDSVVNICQLLDSFSHIVAQFDKTCDLK